MNAIAPKPDAQSRLLGAAGEPPFWGNLGAWSPQCPDETYHAAASRLARYHAEAIALTDADRLLELGAGHGASVRLWASMGVREIITLDRKPTLATLPCTNESDTHSRQTSHRSLCVDFARPWPTLPQVDAIISVDAIYHAPSLPAILTQMAKSLAPAGRWAITTLQINPTLTRPQRVALEAMLRACGIGWQGLWHSSATTADTRVFEQAGLRVQRVDDLSHSVMLGFAAFIDRRKRALSLRERLHPAWWKLRLTADLCRSLVAGGQVRYVLVAGHKQ